MSCMGTALASFSYDCSAIFYHRKLILARKTGFTLEQQEKSVRNDRTGLSPCTFWATAPMPRPPPPPPLQYLYRLIGASE